MNDVATMSAPGQSPPKPISLDLVKHICGLLTSHLDMKNPVQVCDMILVLLFLLKSRISHEHRLTLSSWSLEPLT